MKEYNGKKAEMLQKLVAAAEGKILCKNLLQEIEPLICDYFVAETQLEEDKIVISFLNGQTFKLTVEEQ